MSGSSDLAKELVGVKTKLSEVEAKLEVTENNLEGVQKQLKEKEDRLKEEEAKAQGYAKMEMEIGVLRTSLGTEKIQIIQTSKKLGLPTRKGPPDPKWRWVGQGSENSKGSNF